MKKSTKYKILGRLGALKKKQLKIERDSQASVETLEEMKHESLSLSALEEEIVEMYESSTEMYHPAVEESLIHYQIDGYRIINGKNLSQFIAEIIEHSISCGKSSGLHCENEFREGLATNIYWKCPCNKSLVLESSDSICLNKRFKTREVNYRSVIGTLQSGNGFRDTSSLFNILGVPYMCKPYFNKIESHIDKAVRIEASKSFERWIEILKKDAIENNNFSDQGVPAFSFITDAGWSKRSYKHSYKANSAALPIIDLKTKKIISLEVANKFCYTCSREVDSKERKAHQCYVNYSGSSSGMESDLAVKAIKKLYNDYGIQGNKLIADGDSTLYAKLRDELDWTITKTECVNHLIKNYKRNLFEAKTRNKNLSSILNEHTIAKMCAYIRNVINLYGDIENRDEEKMVRIIKQIPFHIFGYHKNCSDDLCKREKNDDNYDRRMNNNLLCILLNCSNTIIMKISRIHKDITTNLAENYHSIRVKLDHGKVRNYILKGSFELRSIWAALSFNESYTWLENLMKEVLGTIDPVTSEYFQTLSKNLFYRRSNVGDKKRHFQPNKSSQKEEYNPGMAYHDYDLNDSAILSKIIDECKAFLVKITVAENERNNIIVNTQTQLEDEWYNERKKRLTASNFGKICKRRETTDPANLLKLMLYSENKENKYTEYGKKYESLARANYELTKCIPVTKTGLHIHKDYSWIGCSPDGLIEDPDDGPGLVEIKCVAIKEYRQETISNIVEGKANFYLKKDGDSFKLTF